MSWLAGTAQRLRRVFNIDITECEKCEKHNVSVIACIIDRLPACFRLSKKYWYIKIKSTQLLHKQRYYHLYVRHLMKSTQTTSLCNETSTLVHRQQVKQRY